MQLSSSTLLARVDTYWTRFEIALASAVLALECGSLTLWVVLKGLSTPVGSESAAGWATRATLASIALGSLGFFGSRSWPRWRHAAAIAGSMIGALTAKSWLGFPVDYASNVLNWLQQASTLTLFGGLRGIGTRLTILLLLLGGSLATRSGRHITIDLVTRLLPARLARVALIVNTAFASVVCGAAGWGFFDHIAIESFGAEPAASPRAKLGTVVAGLGEHAFILRKQLGLDVRSAVPVLFAGRRYSTVLSGAEWNRWLSEAGFEDRYGSGPVDALRLPPEQTKTPMIIVPGLGEPRGLLASSSNLAFPFGLVLVAARFLFRLVRLLVDGAETASSTAIHASAG